MAWKGGSPLWLELESGQEVHLAEAEAELNAWQLVLIAGTLDIIADTDGDGVVQPGEGIEDDQDERYRHAFLDDSWDADRDGVPDFADGYRLTGLLAEDAHLSVDRLRGRLQVAIDIGQYEDLDPFLQDNFGIIFYYPYREIDFHLDPIDGSVIYEADAIPGQSSSTAGFRVWNKPLSEERDRRPLSEFGDLIVSGEFVSLADIGYSGPGVYEFGLDVVHRFHYDNGIRFDYHPADMPQLRVEFGFKEGSHVHGDVAWGAGKSDSIRFKNKHRIEVLEVQSDDTLKQVAEPKISSPSPVFANTSVDLVNVRATEDGGRLIGDLEIAGSLADRSLDFITGQSVAGGGVIDHIVLKYEDELGESVEQPISVAVTKELEYQSLYAPYPYSGQFSTVITGVPVKAGSNSFTLVAENPFGYSSEYTSYADVDVEFPEEYYDIELLWPNFDSPALVFAPVLTVSVRDQNGAWVKDSFGVDIANRQLTDDSFAFWFVDDELDPQVEFWFDSSQYDPELDLHQLFAELSIPGAGLASRAVALQQVDPAFDVYFGRLYTLEAETAESYLGAQFQVDRLGSTVTGSGDNVHPFVYKFYPTPDMSTTYLKIGDRLMTLIPADDGGYYISSTGELLVPSVAVVDLDNLEPIPAYSIGRRYGFDIYMHGVAAGMFLDTPIDIISGVGDLVGMGWYMLKNYNGVSITYRIVTEGEFFTEENREMFNSTSHAARAIYDILDQIVSDQADLVDRALAGDIDAINELGEEYALMAEFSVELLTALGDARDEMGDYDYGRLVGRIAGEVLIAVVTSGSGTGAQALSKADLITSIVTKLDNLDWIPTSVKGRLNALKNGPFVAAMRTTEMCFIAGTLVHTDHGLVPIEQVQVGDLVLSRDPRTGEQGYKPVINLFTTHPEEVIELSVSGTQGVETITTTGEHPFYLPEREAFIPAREITSRTLLETATRETTAYVSDLENKRGPPESGGVFTTYNFEVADWHTYFVGENAVWVHNSGDAECQRIFAIFDRLLARYNGDADLAFKDFDTRETFSKGQTARIKGLITDVLVRERNPDLNLPDQIWTSGPFPRGSLPDEDQWDRAFGHANLYNHWKKRQDYQQLLHLDTPLKYLERAIEVSGQSATIPDADPEWAVVWKFFSAGPYGDQWEKISYNKITQEKSIKIVSGPNAGQIKTLHPVDDPGTSVAIQLREFELEASMPGSVVSLTRPAGAVD